MPQASDVAVEVRDEGYGRVGQFDPGVVDGGKFVKRHLALGAWSFSAPASHPMCAVLRRPGTGLVVWLYGRPWLTGPMLTWSEVRTPADPTGTVTFTGADDLAVLARDAAWPDPAVADPQAARYANDVRTGPAETLVKTYVAANVGPAAPASRRVGAALRLTVDADQGRGGQVQASPRYQNLLELCAGLLAADGTLTFDVRQRRGATDLVLTVGTVADRTGTVRMDVANDLLAKSTSGVAAPTGTHYLVVGQGEGTARQALQVQDGDAAAAEQAWGFRAEVVLDQRQTDDPDELAQAGLKGLAATGRTAVSLNVEPQDAPSMRYGRDWGVGDRVGVVVAGQVLADVVTEAVLAVDQGDVRVGATVGDPVGYDWEASVTDAVQDLRSRVALLERAP